jgi:hypothetical protein
MSSTWTVTEQDFQIAFNGSLTQLRARFTREEVENFYNLGLLPFLVHQAEVVASKEAGMRFLNNCLAPK